MLLKPSAQQGRYADSIMRQQLGESIAYLCNLDENLNKKNKAILHSAAEALVNNKRLHPLMFGHYARWVHALTHDNNSQAEKAIELICAAFSLGDSYPQYISLGDETLYQSQRLINELMDSGDDSTAMFKPPTTDAFDACKLEISQALGLASKWLPDLAEEMNALVAQFILVGNHPQATVRFDGGSSYMLWGALFVNAEQRRSSVAMLELLAHETAHLLLYAAASQEPLTTNPEDERYSSPLREDLRPMDGIYHATWVSARMAWAMYHLSQHPEISPPAANEARQALEADIRHFKEGHSVVERHGQLTQTGRRLMNDAASWIASIAD